MSTIILRKYIRDMLLENRGYSYEKKIQDIINQFCKTDFKTAGYSDGPDATFQTLNPAGKLTDYNLEVKFSQNCFAGQKNLNFDKATQAWSWYDPDDKPSSLADFLNEDAFFDNNVMNIIKPRLNIFMGEHKIPSFPAIMTMRSYADIRASMKKQPVIDKRKETLELGKFALDVKAIYSHYKEKNVHYIQVGNGCGFYFLDEDIANLKVAQFEPKIVKLRTRFKWSGPSTCTDNNKDKFFKLDLNNGIIFSGLKKSNVDLERSLDFLSKQDGIKSKTNIENNNVIK